MNYHGGSGGGRVAAFKYDGEDKERSRASKECSVIVYVYCVALIAGNRWCYDAVDVVCV